MASTWYPEKYKTNQIFLTSTQYPIYIGKYQLRNPQNRLTPPLYNTYQKGYLIENWLGIIKFQSYV